MQDKQMSRFFEENGFLDFGMISQAKPERRLALSQVLETGLIPQRFFLSGTACAGILRRAEKRGKSLPPSLHAALQAVAHAIRTAQTGSNGWGINTDGVAYTLDSAQQAVAFAQNQRNEVRTMDVAGALAAEPGAKQQTYIQQGMAVRRLTPVECERLMGFPDSYTSIPWRKKPAEDCPDGPRYKALGNSWAVPCVAWIGRRIAAALQLRAAA